MMGLLTTGACMRVVCLAHCDPLSVAFLSPSSFLFVSPLCPSTASLVPLYRLSVASLLPSTASLVPLYRLSVASLLPPSCP